MAVFVDRPHEPADIEPPPGFGTAIASDFVFGMGKVNGKFVILLNIQQVLAIDGLAATDAAAAADATRLLATH